MEMTAKIAAALHEVMSKVGYVQKTGRNSFHNYPKEVAHAVHLRSVLSRVINRRNREDSPHD